MNKKLFTILMMWLITIILSSQVSAVELPLRVVVDGERLQFPDAQPFIDPSERLQIPSRFIGESLGAKVSWDGKAQKAPFVKGNTSLVLFIGKSEYQVNNQKKQMDTKALLKNGRIFVPARYVAEAFGAGVAWDKAIRTVYINTDGSVPTLNQPPAEDEIYDWIKVQSDVLDVEYAITIQWSSDPVLLNARYNAAEKIFAERYNIQIAEEVFSYARLKQTRVDRVSRTEIKFGEQVITVFGQGLAFEIKVWKKGAL